MTLRCGRLSEAAFMTQTRFATCRCVLSRRAPPTSFVIFCIACGATLLLNPATTYAYIVRIQRIVTRLMGERLRVSQGVLEARIDDDDLEAFWKVVASLCSKPLFGGTTEPSPQLAASLWAYAVRLQPALCWPSLLF